MWISRIAVNNFRCLNAAEFRPRKRCVLIGENNSGKSTILRALELALSPNVSLADLALENDDYFEGIAADKRASTTVSVELECDLEADDAELIGLLAELVEVDKGRQFFRVRYEYGVDDKFDKSREPSPRVFFPKKPDDRYKVSHRNWMPFYVLEAVRDARQEMRVNNHTFWGRLIKAIKFNDGSEKSIKTKVAEIDDLLLKEELIKDIKGALSKTLKATMSIPEDKGVDLTFSSPSLSEMLQTLTVAVNHGNKKTYSLFQHGLGLQNVIFFGVARAFLEHHKKNIGVRNLILGIEEPEAHLHPHVQRTVFNDICGMPNQVFVATHSTHIANRTDPRDILLIRRTNEGSGVHQVGQDFITDVEASTIQRLMDANRSEAYFARAVLLVEGDSELAVLPHLSMLHGTDLDTAGITLLSMDGTNTALFLKLFCKKGLGIPHAVLMDTKGTGTKNVLNSLIACGEIDDKRKAELLKDDAQRTAFLRERHIYVLPRDLEETLFDAGLIDIYAEEVEALEGKGVWASYEKSV
jgi:putative ATP-dependent endonuclease of the OLD family